MVESEAKNKSLNPTILKLGIVSFFGDIASEMLYPIIPIFLTTVLGASMASMGLIEGCADAVSSLLKTYAGHWSDQSGKRKPFVVVGYLLSALAKPMTGFAHAWTHVLVARCSDRLGKGIRTAPRDALLSESVDPALRGAAFGWHRFMDTMGAAIGPLFAILLLSLNSQDLRSIFYWALIPGLISVLIVLSIRDSAGEPVAKKSENPFKLWNRFESSFRVYLLAWGTFTLANSSDVFLLMKAKSSGFSTEGVIFLYCAYNLVYAFSSPWFGRLSDRIERKKIMSAGLIILALVYLGFCLANESWNFWDLFLLYGLFMGATEGVGKALAVDFSPRDLKATGMGILGTVTGLCAIVSSTLAGLLWDHLGSSWTFYFGCLGALVAVFVLSQVRSPQVR